jgi:hypothetical protein
MELLTEEEIEKTYNSKTKLSIITSIVNTYIHKTYLTRNVWMLTQISELLQEVETNAGKSLKIVKSLCTLVSYIKMNKPLEFAISHDNQQNLDHLLYSLVSVSPDIVFMRDYVDDTTYSYLGILYNNISASLPTNSTSPHASLAIVEKIISINSTRELDGYDIMFLFLLKVIEVKADIDSKIKQYIELSKDIFYYRLRKKDRPIRVNIIYFSIYVLISKKVKNTALAATNATSSTNTEYLNVIPTIDHNQLNEMDYLRARNRVTCNTKTKNIKTISKSDIESKNIYIIKK